MILHCTCGAVSMEHEYTTNVGKLAKTSGFIPVFTDEGRFLFVCSQCWKLLQEHARAILCIVQDEFVHFGSFLRKDE